MKGPSFFTITLYYIGFFLLITVPTVSLIIWAALGPQPYLLQREELGEKWINMRRTFEEYMVEVHSTESPAQAKNLAKNLFQQTPAKSRVSTLNTHRYKRTDNDNSGLLIPLEEYVIRIEARDKEKSNDFFVKLPFVAKNPETNQVYTFFNEKIGLVFIIIGCYTAFLFLYLTKGAPAVGQIKPEKNIRPLEKGELKSRLLKLATIDIPFTVRVENNDELLCEWRLVDAKWSGLIRSGGLRIDQKLNLQLDGGSYTARATLTTRAIRKERSFAGFLGSFIWSRDMGFYHYERESQCGLDFRNGEWLMEKDYSYKFTINELREPIVHLIVDSGWTYRPVLGFSFLFR